MGEREVPHLLDLAALAERLGTSERHVRRLVAERRVPYLKVGRFVRFDPEAIARWLESCRVEDVRLLSPGTRRISPRG
jgi:excisionase family DNA binding protein